MWSVTGRVLVPRCAIHVMTKPLIILRKEIPPHIDYDATVDNMINMTSGRARLLTDSWTDSLGDSLRL